MQQSVGPEVMSGNLDRTSAKILVLGDSGVGKSSLIHLICQASTLNSAQWTIGCSIDVKLHNNNYLEFWDIGGSRGHKIARRFLYQDYHGIILVFDSTNKKSRLNLDEWLREAAQKANDRDSEITVPTITIGTKKDLLPYKSLIELQNDLQTGNLNSSNSSVVNFNESISPENSPLKPSIHHDQTGFANNNSFLYRRLHTSNYSTTSSSYSPLNASFHSMPEQSTSPFSSIGDHMSMKHSVIYVNTQDVTSFSPGSINQEILNKFFKCVIERRHNRFHI